MAANPLHCLIEELKQLYDALWQHHHATKETFDEANRAWHALTGAFWKRHHFPDDALRAVADPVLAWNKHHGPKDSDSVACIERAAERVVCLARHRPRALPAADSNKDDIRKSWEQQGEFLTAVRETIHQMRRLAAIAGFPWPGNHDSGKTGVETVASARRAEEPNGARQVQRPSDIQLGHIRGCLDRFLERVQHLSSDGKSVSSSQAADEYQRAAVLTKSAQELARQFSELGRALLFAGLADRATRNRPQTPRNLLLVDLDRIPDFAHATLCLAIDEAAGDSLDAWQIADVLANMLLVDESTLARFLASLHSLVEGIIASAVMDTTDRSTPAPAGDDAESSPGLDFPAIAAALRAFRHTVAASPDNRHQAEARQHAPAVVRAEDMLRRLLSPRDPEWRSSYNSDLVNPAAPPKVRVLLRKVWARINTDFRLPPPFSPDQRDNWLVLLDETLQAMQLPGLGGSTGEAVTPSRPGRADSSTRTRPNACPGSTPAEALGQSETADASVAPPAGTEHAPAKARRRKKERLHEHIAMAVREGKKTPKAIWDFVQAMEPSLVRNGASEINADLMVKRFKKDPKYAELANQLQSI